MSLEILPEDVKSRLKCGLTITTINQCVIELILNAIDAKATAIATQLNFRTFRIQVVDNGDGISKSNLNLIASHYRTNRCHSLKDYQRNVKYHGYRGESLACMKEICSKLSIVSREINSNETYLRVFEGELFNKAKIIKFRPSEGTTVTLENVFYNLPVRRNRINPELDFDALKQFLLALSVIYPNISLTLRNDATTKMLFKNEKCNTVTESLIAYCPELQKKSFLDLRFNKHKLRISGLLSKKMHSNGKLQFIYVNKRPVFCSKLQKLIATCLKSNKTTTSKKQDVFPIYALNIKCPYTNVNLSFEKNNYVASFDKFDVIQDFIINILSTLTSKDKGEIINISPSVEKNRTFNNDDECSYSQLTEICNLSGLVQSKVTKLKENKLLRNENEFKRKPNENTKKQSAKGFEIKPQKSDENFQTNDQQINLLENDKNQSKMFEIEIEKPDNQRKTSKNVESTKIIKSRDIPKAKRNVQSTNYFSKYFVNNTIANEVLTNLENEETEFINAEASPYYEENANFEENNNEYEPILSNDPGEQTGKLEIMQKFLTSTHMEVNMNQAVPYSTGVFLKAKSNIVPTNRKNDALDTSMITRFLTKPTDVSLKDYRNEQTEHSPSRQTSKFVQTSFMKNTPLHLNCKNTGNRDNTFVYHINFNKLNQFKQDKLCVQLQLNKNNVDIKFDLNQSKYFPDSIKETEHQKYEFKGDNNDKTIVYSSKKTFTSVKNQTLAQSLNQSKYFIGSKSVTKNKSDQKSFHEIESIGQRSCDLRNVSTDDIISATINEEVHLDEPKQSTFYNISKSIEMPYNKKNLNQSELFHFKNTNTEDYHIWTDGSKLDIDFDSGSNQDIFKPSCSKVSHPRNKTVNNNDVYNKIGLKRHSTDPVHCSKKSLDNSKKRLRTFLSQDASSSDESYKEFVEQLQQENLINIKEIENIRCSKNDTVISSNLKNEFVNTSMADYQKAVKDKEWYTQNNGEFYYHKKTGFTTYKNPTSTRFDFKFKPRNEDIPKGNSPIITRVEKCLLSLSQNKKERLYTEILKSYDEELDTVKWKKIIKENDYTTFFAALFKNRTKHNPIQIPDISKKAIPKEVVQLFSSGQSKNFANDLFSHLEVIGQLDQKFILAFCKYNQLLFAFDQHAVHERIRLERLQQTYINEDNSFKSIASNTICKFNFTMTEIDCLMKNQTKINNLGLYFTLAENDYITVDQIPTCLHNKFEKMSKNQEKDTYIILMSLFEEIISNLKNSRGSLHVVPKVLQNILNLEACRGAIKFGEALSMKDCQKLMNDLGQCNLPFQCAHGRPTLVPLVELTDNYHTLLEV